MTQRQQETDLLIGVLVDVSGSMLSAFGEKGKMAVSRLDAFKDALEDMVRRGAERLKTEANGIGRQEPRLFAYGFGFGNPLSAFLGRSGPPVRDLLSAPGTTGSAVPISDLAARWPEYRAHVQSLASEMFGNTPMGAALEIGQNRLRAEAKAGTFPVLFILSDGDPTDMSLEEVAQSARRIQRDGVSIVSCYATDADITEPKRLYGEYQPGWPDAAKLMFDCASLLNPTSPFHAQLREYGWRIDPGARLFAQVNESEALNQFLNIVLSPLTKNAMPLPGEAAGAGGGEPQAQVPILADKKPKPRASVAKRMVVFIHGLGGDWEGTWGRFPSLLMDEPRIRRNFETSYYSYPTSVGRLPFSSKPARIQELADGLETQIRVNNYNHAVLVCHSLGGLIARHYLVNEVKKNRPLRVDAVALFAVPNNGAGLAEAAKFISWRNNHLAQLCRTADILELLNDDWITFGLQTKVRTRFIVGTQDRVVDPRSAKAAWGNPDVDTITGRGHLDIVKPMSADDLSVAIVRNLLLDKAELAAG